MLCGNIFPRKKTLTFHVFRKQHAWNVKYCFLGKWEKCFSISSKIYSSLDVYCKQSSTLHFSTSTILVVEASLVTQVIFPSKQPTIFLYYVYTPWRPSYAAWIRMLAWASLFKYHIYPYYADSHAYKVNCVDQDQTAQFTVCHSVFTFYTP